MLAKYDKNRIIHVEDISSQSCPDFSHINRFFSIMDTQVFGLPFQIAISRSPKSESLETWQIYFYIFLVNGCKISQKSDNPCRRYKRSNLSQFCWDKCIYIYIYLPIPR